MDVREQIEEIIVWYRDLPLDFLGINDLLYNRQRLVGLYVEFAVEVGLQRKIWSISKVVYEKTKIQLRVRHLADGVAKAEAISRANSIKELELQNSEEGEYYKLYYCMKAYEEVLSAMSQQIAQLREELSSIKYRGN